jgi:hypothetical protein
MAKHLSKIDNAKRAVEDARFEVAKWTRILNSTRRDLLRLKKK